MWGKQFLLPGKQEQGLCFSLGLRAGGPCCLSGSGARFGAGTEWGASLSEDVVQQNAEFNQDCDGRPGKRDVLKGRQLSEAACDARLLLDTFCLTFSSLARCHMGERTRMYIDPRNTAHVRAFPQVSDKKTGCKIWAQGLSHRSQDLHTTDYLTRGCSCRLKLFFGENTPFYSLAAGFLFHKSRYENLPKPLT